MNGTRRSNQASKLEQLEEYSDADESEAIFQLRLSIRISVWLKRRIKQSKIKMSQETNWSTPAQERVAAYIGDR
jgi:hypothetical protein